MVPSVLSSTQSVRSVPSSGGTVHGSCASRHGNSVCQSFSEMIGRGMWWWAVGALALQISLFYVCPRAPLPFLPKTPRPSASPRHHRVEGGRILPRRACVTRFVAAVARIRDRMS